MRNTPAATALTDSQSISFLLTAMLGAHREQIEVRHLVAEMHDGETGDFAVAARDEHAAIAAEDRAAHARRCPGPSETLLDQVARHFSDLQGIRVAGEAESREFRH
jgi:hypothetical protein